jgi:hypothetical protein
VGHALLRGEGDIVAGLDELVSGKTETVTLDNLLGQGLRDGDGLRGVQVVGDTRLFEKRRKDIGRRDIS